MSAANIIRAQEWWAYKLSPLLAVGYATAVVSGITLYQTLLWLMFLLAALIVGAIYVSVINDITDLDEDIASGKSNRVQQVPERLRWLIPAGCILLGFVFGYFLYPDLLSCFLYLMSWIVFTMYSVKPIRLKNRGILGVFADGCGAHVFPSLLIVSSVSYRNGQPLNWVWFAAIGVWALCYGLRGILWHQFSDRENDIKVNLNTYASQVSPLSFRPKARLIFAVEILALAVILCQLPLSVMIVALLFYAVLVFIRYRRYKSVVILVLKPENRAFQILMADYYQLFFPIAILLYSISVNRLNMITLAIHILLFPYIVWRALYDYVIYGTAIVSKGYRKLRKNDGQ